MNDLNRAIKREDLEEVLRLLAGGCDVNAPDETHPNTAGETALMVASSRGNTAIMKALLDAGADINAAWPGEWSPLARAAASKSGSAVVLLLERGANARAPFAGETIAQWIRRHWAHRLDVLSFLPAETE